MYIPNPHYKEGSTALMIYTKAVNRYKYDKFIGINLIFLLVSFIDIFITALFFEAEHNKIVYNSGMGLKILFMFGCLIVLNNAYVASRKQSHKDIIYKVVVILCLVYLIGSYYNVFIIFLNF